MQLSKCCGHNESEHYGTPDRNCNHAGCTCTKFVVEPQIEIENKAVMQRIAVVAEKVKRGPGRPRKVK